MLMCGICGILGMNDKVLVQRMTDVLFHRGPDDFGFYFDDNFGMGHRRLSIIDLSKGHQPIHNEDESVWIVYNGEIYNYKELKRDLQNKGHEFYTYSDTEVIIHAYEEYEELFPKKLRGMFALAIWDTKDKKLILVRDRLGIKPLYYTVNDGTLLFASEIKALLQYKGIKREVNISSLHNFLTHRYIPGSNTMFEGIRKLLPGNMLVCKNGNIKISEYWDLNVKSVDVQSEEHCSKALYKLLEESVRVRLMSDVPLGAYLSGGIDSSAIVGIMSALTDEPVKTFSIGFGVGEPIDELSYARMVAEYFETDHHELTMSSEDAEKLLPKIIWHLDDSIVDPAILPTYFISEFAKRYVKVILTGEGADELFAGYEGYKSKMRYYHRRGQLPFYLKKILPKFATLIPDYRVREHIKMISTEPKDHILWSPLFNEKEKKKIYSKHFLNKIEHIKPGSITSKYFQNSNMDLLNKLLYVDIKTWLPDNILLKVDKTTMANSIEARVPFLDHKLVEFSATIPYYLKLKNQTEKYILKKSTSRLLPKNILNREKHGFSVPIYIWINKYLKDMVSEILSPDAIRKRGYFRYNMVQKVLQHAQSPKYSHQLWGLLTLELWHKIYIDEDTTTSLIGKES